MDNLTFCTLTIPPNNITYKKIYHRLISRFLHWLVEEKEVKTYVWKGEFGSNGRIHYHVVFPKTIDPKEIQTEWNGIMKEEGVLEEFAKSNFHYNPTSIDVRKVKNTIVLSTWLLSGIALPKDPTI